MKRIHLKTFALTGSFGPVKIGMTKDQVIKLLGQPEADQDFGTGFAGILYSRYEFFFDSDTGTLDAIQNDHLQANCSNHKNLIEFKNDKIEIDTWFLAPNKDFTYKEVTKILKEENIPFQAEKLREINILRFESGVYLDFDNGDDPEGIDVGEGIINEAMENRENSVLIAIRHFPHRWK